MEESKSFDDLRGGLRAGAGETEGTHYLVIEYVAGMDVVTVIRSIGEPQRGSQCEVEFDTGITPLRNSHSHETLASAPAIPNCSPRLVAVGDVCNLIGKSRGVGTQILEELTRLDDISSGIDILIRVTRVIAEAVTNRFRRLRNRRCQPAATRRPQAPAVADSGNHQSHPAGLAKFRAARPDVTIEGDIK